MLVDNGVNEIRSFLRKNQISDEHIRVLNSASSKITWEFSDRKKQCDRVMFVVSPKSLKMYMLFFKIQFGECRISFVSQLKADEFVPTIQTEIGTSLTTEKFKNIFVDMEKGKKFKDLENVYKLTWHRQCCDIFLELNPDFLKMMDGIYGLDFKEYINSLESRNKLK